VERGSVKGKGSGGGRLASERVVLAAVTNLEVRLCTLDSRLWKGSLDAVCCS
jgi:hypothetical protein